MRILTGGNIPPGADTVVMVEQTRRTNGTVTVLSGVDRGANILRKAEDARQGDILIARGTAIGPMQVGICAAVGKSSVCVHLRPRVSVLCTGEELRGIDEAVRPHEIRNSNGFALCSALRTYGFADVACSIVPDDIQVLLAALRRAVRRSDLVLLTGGVSAGKYDFVPEAVMKLGSTIRFHGVAIKPGKPLLSATLPGNRHIFGLPGNPLSTMNCYFEFILPALRRLCGFQAETCHPSLRVPLASRISSKGGGRARFVLARLRWSRQGPCVEPVKSHSSADLVAGGQADGTILVPPTVRGMKAGTLVEFRPWRPLP